MSIYFATPCYRSDPLEAQKWACNVVATLKLEGACIGTPVGSFLTISQALFVYEFLKSECTHLFSREDDVFVEPDVLERMLDAKVPAIVAPYLVRNEAPPRMEAVFDSAGNVVWAGLGCALLSRAVLQMMWNRYRDELKFMQNGIELVGIFRDFFADRDDGRQLIKPDHAFWFRVRECGFQIEALDDAIVNHAGNISHFKKAA